MNPIAKELLKSFLTEEELQNTVGVFGGGFQPPTKGHLEVVKQALERYPLLDKFIIFVGTGGGRSNITQEQSVKIWNIYKKLLPSKVEIIPSANPISSIYSYTKENPETKVKWFLGSREGREEDFADFAKRTKSADKPNLEVINIITKVPVSGTAARKSLGEKELFFTFLPAELPLEDKEKIYSILSGINEWVPEPEIDNLDDYADDALSPLDLKIPPHFVDRVNDRRNNPPIETDELYDFFDKLSDEKDELEDMLDDEGEIVATDSDTDINIPLAKDNRKPNTVVAKTIMRKRNFMTPNKKLVFEEDLFDSLEDNSEFRKLLISLTTYMMDQINIDPLPNVEFIEDDTNNANELLGKTAYYDPNTQTIVLYTYNRHPKDVLRSYAHEMIHHKQNLEGKIQNIQGQDINEDDYLKELEAEAYLQGNGLLFRGWENSLKND